MNKIIRKLLTTILISTFILGSLTGCGDEQPPIRPSDSSSGGNNSQNSSEEYYPPDDRMNLIFSELDFPSEAEAENFTVDGWKTSSPSSGTRMTNFLSVAGYWKAVMISDPDNTTEEGRTVDHFNVEIYGSPSETKVIYNWNKRYYEKTGAVEDFLTISAGHTGSFSNGSITANLDSTKLVLTDFWTDGSTQYALGKYTWPDGSVGYVGLIRP